MLSTLLDCLREDLADVAQEVYDAWHQDEDGYDEVVGTGGICSLIADAFLAVVLEQGFDALQFTDSEQVHEWCIVEVQGVWYHFDIPYGIYETCHGLMLYTKTEEVEFNAYDVNVWHATPEEVDYGREEEIAWL